MVEKLRKHDVIFLCLPFLLMTNIIRIIASDKKIFIVNPGAFIIVSFANIVFDVLFIFLIVSLAKSFKGIIGRLIYIIGFSGYFIFFIINCIYYKFTKLFFSIHLTEFAEEGSGYIWSVVRGTKWYFFVVFAVVLILGVFASFLMKSSETNKWKQAVITIVVFAVIHTFIPMCYGSQKKGLGVLELQVPRNVYESFNDPNKSMKVCGFFEYVVRDIVKYWDNSNVKIDDSEVEYLDEKYTNLSKAESNDYTGLFKGKNVIFLQLEGIDYWLMDEKTMPNLWSLKNNAFVFNDHYSFYNGAGSTFNSEFAVNTGFICPVSFYKNPAMMNNYTFKNDMPDMFKKEGYSINCFHMNTGEFYNRRLNYLNWGYEYYYGMKDEYKYDNLDYELDSELMNNTDFSNQMFDKKQPFVDYLITYTPHTPFNTKDGLGKYLAERKYGKDSVPDLNEEETIRLMASETDEMIGLLIQKLKEKGLYDNTVIVTYADHYLYTVEDKSILSKYKETDNNLINHTPFLIWSSDIDSTKEIDKTNSQLDILPTVLNLFGIEYDDNFYIGKDILDDKYEGYVFFDDFSWYDGNVYVENGKVTNGGNIDEKELNEKNELINSIIKRNDLTLKYDYFGNSILKK